MTPAVESMELCLQAGIQNSLSDLVPGFLL